MADELIDTDEIQKRWPVSSRQAQWLRRNPAVRSVKIGKRLYFVAADVEALWAPKAPHEAPKKKISPRSRERDQLERAGFAAR